MSQPTPPASTTEAAPPSILAREDGATIAYHRLPGQAPGVVFLTGFKSDMTGGKALALEAFCRERGQAYVRFDYLGHGASSGAFEDGTIGRWTDDAVAVIDALTAGPQVLVGSSMGGWIMLLAALKRPERVVGLVGIAAAADFTEDLIATKMTPAQKADFGRLGYIELRNPYEDAPYRIARALLDEGRAHCLLKDEIPLDCPVRLIHGMLDGDVPWRISLRIAERIRSADVEVQIVKNGEHRLSEPHDLERLCRTVGQLLDRP